LDLLIYGLINASILLTIAVGFSLAYGVSRLANFAYGAGIYPNGLCGLDVFEIKLKMYSSSLIFSPSYKVAVQTYMFIILQRLIKLHLISPYERSSFNWMFLPRLSKNPSV